jgi:hypothetical protein
MYDTNEASCLFKSKHVKNESKYECQSVQTNQKKLFRHIRQNTSPFFFVPKQACAHMIVEHNPVEKNMI